METAMLVEAGPKRRKLLSELLEEEGLNVESVKTAEEALSRAAKSAPGLVLLDIHMPTVSGLEVLKQLRGMDVRIILLTANESAAVRHNLYSFGDVIAGAVETTAFQARFRGILERHSRENQRRVRVASSGHPVSSHVLAALHDPETGARCRPDRIVSRNAALESCKALPGECRGAAQEPSIGFRAASFDSDCAELGNPDATSLVEGKRARVDV